MAGTIQTNRRNIHEETNNCGYAQRSTCTVDSGFGNMIDQIKEAQPDATVSDDGLTENSHTANDEVVSDVDTWLKNL